MRIAAVQFGFKESARNFRRLGSDAIHELGEVLDEIVDDMTEVEETVFNSQGRRGGGMWKRPTVRWERRKIETGGDPRTGHYRRKLRRSVTYRGDPNMLLRIDARQGIIQFGSKLPYSRTAQEHRPFIKFVPGDRKRWARMIAKRFRDEWRGRARKRKA